MGGTVMPAMLLYGLFKDYVVKEIVNKEKIVQSACWHIFWGNRDNSLFADT